MIREHDVAIVGGGPGGLHAARLLAERGVRVAVLEEHASIGMPVHCTGVLAQEACDEFDVPPDVVLNSLSTATFVSPTGRSIAHTTSRVEAVVIDRRRFDEHLADAARAAGAAVIRAERVSAITVDSAGVTLHTPGGASRHARASILACGASYTLQRQLGLGLPRVMLRSAQMELPARSIGDVELYFGGVVAPKGFGWAVPVVREGGTFVRVGVMRERDAAAGFERMVQRIAPRWRVSVPAGVRPRQKLLPLAPIPRTFTDRVLAIGDAAGLVKATTGGGIYYSLVSATLAADTLTRALREDRLDAHALRPYEDAWRARLLPELQAQLALRMAAQRLTDAEIDALFELAQTDGIMPIVRRTARFNRHRDLILALFRHPPARRVLFRRLTLARP
jgi:geranylgeranyl reductase family protein